MEKEPIYISPNFLISLKIILPVLMLIFSYMKNEFFFLILFTALCIVYISESSFDEEKVVMSEKDLLKHMPILSFISLSISYIFFFPQFSYSVALPFFVFVLFWIFNKAFAFYKFRKVILYYHLSSRIAFIVLAAFTFITLITGNPYLILFIVVGLVGFFSVIEEFLILRKMRRYNERIDSLLFKG